MVERPPFLPRAARRVVKASAALSWGLKAVWLELHSLDQGPEGAWIAGRHLASRLGLSVETVETYRRQLQGWNLLRGAPRPGARTHSWFPQLPAAAIPTTDRPPDDEIAACAAALDARLATARGGSGSGSGADRSPGQGRIGVRVRGGSGSGSGADRSPGLRSEMRESPEGTLEFSGNARVAHATDGERQRQTGGEIELEVDAATGRYRRRRSGGAAR